MTLGYSFTLSFSVKWGLKGNNGTHLTGFSSRINEPVQVKTAGT